MSETTSGKTLDGLYVEKEAVERAERFGLRITRRGDPIDYTEATEAKERAWSGGEGLAGEWVPGLGDDIEESRKRLGITEGGGMPPEALENPGVAVNNLIALASQQAGERVEAATLDPSVKLARAIAAELKGQVLETDSGDLYLPLDDDVPNDAEIAALVAEVED